MKRCTSALALSSLAMLLLVPAPARASESELIHVLEHGQTLAILANFYGLDRELLIAANPGLVPEHLPVGARIRIPLPPQGWPSYIVRAGDTLLDLAVRCGCPARVLCNLNSISETTVIAGRRLLVPRQPGVGLGTLNPPVGEAVPVAPGPGPALVSVAPGDVWVEVRLPGGARAWAPRASLLVGAASPMAPSGVIQTAQRFVGAPYRWGGQTPNGVDCSGYVQEVYDLAGHHLPRLADEQFNQTVPVTQDQALPGDLVFFSTYLPGPSHVGIFLGDGRFLHASSHGVMEAHLSDPYFASRYLGVRRIRDWATPVSASSGAAPVAPGFAVEPAPIPPPAPAEP